MDNYLDLAIEDVYEILCEGEYHWPKHFTVTEKHGILDQMMEYFAGKDEFEKCIRLQTIKQSIV
jgi:hypothetical protein